MFCTYFDCSFGNIVPYSERCNHTHFTVDAGVHTLSSVKPSCKLGVQCRQKQKMVSAGNRLSPQSLSCCIEVEMARRKKGEEKKTDPVSWPRKKLEIRLSWQLGSLNHPKSHKEISKEKKSTLKKYEKKCICGPIYMSVQKLALRLQPLYWAF